MTSHVTRSAARSAGFLLMLTTACASGAPGEAAGDTAVEPPAGPFQEERSGSLAAYVDEPTAVQGAVLTLKDTWFTDVIPPGGGSTQLRWEYQPRALEWTLEKRVDIGEAPPTSAGSAAGQRADATLARVLAAIRTAGLLDGQNPATTPRQGFYEAHHYQFTLQLDGKHGPARLARELPYGAEHFAGERQGRCFRALLEDPALTGG
ncbi:MAG: hypothetical protein AAF628_23200 [Planctomycetota bacterium]